LRIPKIKTALLLPLVFMLTALLLLGVEMLKNMLLAERLSDLQSDGISIVVGASIMMALAAWVRRSTRLSSELSQSGEILQLQQKSRVALGLQAVDLHTARTDLLKSRGRYVELYDFAPVAYVSIDDLGMITAINWKATMLFGLGREQLLQLPFEQLIASDERELWQQQLSNLRAAERGVELGFELALIRADGSFFHANLSCQQDSDDTDTASMLHITLLDISQIKQLQHARHQDEIRLQAMFEAMPDLMFVAALDGTVLSYHSPRSELLLAPVEDFVGKQLAEFMPAAASAVCMAALEEANAEDYSAGKQYELDLPQGRMCFELSVARKKTLDGQMPLFVVLARDVTERKQAEIKIKRLSELYVVLSQCNQAIVRSRSAEDLFAKICHDVVSFGGMKMAWIGLVDAGSQQVRVATAYGDDHGYLNDIEINVDADSAFGRGPTGVSIRENKVVIVEDYQHDPLTLPWRNKAAQAAWLSCAALPIKCNGVTIGAFSLYSCNENTFDEDIRKLLVEMTEDISFALDSFARESARKAAEEALIASEYRWKFAIEGSGDGVWDWDIVTDKKVFSKRWKQILGYAETDPLPTGAAWDNRFHPEDTKYVAASMQAYLGGVTSDYYIECRMKCKDGSYKWIMSRGMVVSRGANGQPLRMIGTTSDITERKMVENDLRIAATAFESQEAMLVTDANNMILRTNYAFTKMSGYALDEVVGKTPSLFNSGRHDSGFFAAMWGRIHSTGSWHGEIWNKRKNGVIYPAHITITAVKSDIGSVTNYVSNSIDITLTKAAADEIQTLAFYDPLTKLPNRRLFVDRLNQALVASVRSHRDGALLFLDMDNFKTLNDSLGHDIGDLLLQQVAERLLTCVRETDTIARIGGDEYVVMLEDLSEHALEAAAQAEVIGEKILSALNQPYQLAMHEYQSSVSIGVALFSNHNQSQEELLKHADIAMYQAKKAGRNALRFFDPQMQDAINARVDLERELRKAIDKQQLELHYQVQVNTLAQATGAEALIRWRHPQRGLVSPFEFIPLAEETGLILPIGLWVLEVACAQLKLWEQNVLSRELTLSINISARQFRQLDFVAQVTSALQRHNINPMLLKLELTESILLENIDDTIAIMNTLKEIGIRFSLDDFGTGYSSLQYLKQLPLYQLKIDRSFVRDIAVDSSDQAIVRTVIAMARTLNLDVIAEGVETEEQRQLLLSNDCGHYQGYLFGRPVPIMQFETELRQAQLG
jgi:diguanylate cyclase (GGDEF)-like protein/PAS domain S-box-containing protein